MGSAPEGFVEYEIPEKNVSFRVLSVNDFECESDNAPGVVVLLENANPKEGNFSLILNINELRRLVHALKVAESRIIGGRM